MFTEVMKKPTVNTLDQWASMAVSSEAKLCVRNIIIENSREERDEFKKQIEELIKLKVDCRVNVDLRLDRRGDFYAFVFMNDKSRVP